MKDQTEVVTLFPFDGITVGACAGWLLMMVFLVSLGTTSTVGVASGASGETGKERMEKEQLAPCIFIL